MSPESRITKEVVVAKPGEWVAIPDGYGSMQRLHNLVTALLKGANAVQNVGSQYILLRDDRFHYGEIGFSGAQPGGRLFPYLVIPRWRLTSMPKRVTQLQFDASSTLASDDSRDYLRVRLSTEDDLPVTLTEIDMAAAATSLSRFLSSPVLPLLTLSPKRIKPERPPKRTGTSVLTQEKKMAAAVQPQSTLVMRKVFQENNPFGKSGKETRTRELVLWHRKIKGRRICIETGTIKTLRLMWEGQNVLGADIFPRGQILISSPYELAAGIFLRPMAGGGYSLEDLGRSGVGYPDLVRGAKGLKLQLKGRHLNRVPVLSLSLSDEESLEIKLAPQRSLGYTLPFLPGFLISLNLNSPIKSSGERL